MASNVMGRSSVLAAAMLFACAALPPAQQRSVESLIKDLRSRDRQTEYAAFEELWKRGPAAAPAVPALIDLLRRAGWDTGESRYAMDVLGRIGAPARPALPLLVHFMVASESGDMHVQACIEAIADGTGPPVVPYALLASAQEAKRLWTIPGFKGVPENMFDPMAVARTGFGRAFESFGVDALSGLKQGLRHRDPFVQAEAAAWLGMLGPRAKVALPSLREARQRARLQWPRYEIDQAIRQLETEPAK